MVTIIITIENRKIHKWQKKNAHIGRKTRKEVKRLSDTLVGSKTDQGSCSGATWIALQPRGLAKKEMSHTSLGTARDGDVNKVAP